MGPLSPTPAPLMRHIADGGDSRNFVRKYGRSVATPPNCHKFINMRQKIDVSKIFKEFLKRIKTHVYMVVIFLISKHTCSIFFWLRRRSDWVVRLHLAKYVLSRQFEWKDIQFMIENVYCYDMQACEQEFRSEINLSCYPIMSGYWNHSNFF